jgi:hypothetical protein
MSLYRHRGLVFGLLVVAFMLPQTASAACVLTCPADIHGTVKNNSDVLVVDYTVTASADCTGIVQQSGLPSGSGFPVGTTTNLFKDAGSAVTCRFDVVIIDVGRAGAPALGWVGLSALVAFLAGVGVWSARRRRAAAS